MTLAETSASFLACIRENESSSPRFRARADEKALLLLTEYFSSNIALSEITPASLRDFLGKWYVENACASRHHDVESLQSNSRPAATGTRDTYRDQNKHGAESEPFPQPGELLDSLTQFFRWIGQKSGTDFELAAQSALAIEELSHTLPRALEITWVLSRWFRERGGAFSFPEFLTSFEEGGHSQYDIDTPGTVGALEGYFRILRVEGSSVEAEEMISEERVWPIVFPPEVASLMDDHYIINLELVRSPAGWEIAGCGFAYPPGTDI